MEQSQASHILFITGFLFFSGIGGLIKSRWDLIRVRNPNKIKCEPETLFKLCGESIFLNFLISRELVI